MPHHIPRKSSPCIRGIHRALCHVLFPGGDRDKTVNMFCSAIWLNLPFPRLVHPTFLAGAWNVQPHP